MAKLLTSEWPMPSHWAGSAASWANHVSDGDEAPDSAATKVMASNPEIEKLLRALNVELVAFEIHDLDPACNLVVSAGDNLTICFVVAGSGTAELDGRARSIERGALIAVPRRAACRLVNDPLDGAHSAGQDTCDSLDDQRLSSTALRIARVAMAASPGHGMALFEGLDAPLFQAPDARTERIFETMLSEWAAPQFGSRSLIETELKRLLILLLRDAASAGDARTPLRRALLDHRVARVINAIVAAPGDRHTLRSLAHQAGLKPADLCARFQAAVGASPLEFVQQTRIGMAKRLLRDTADPIKFIANLVGFASRSHFSREFTRLVGADPTTFRKASTGPGPSERIIPTIAHQNTAETRPDNRTATAATIYLNA